MGLKEAIANIWASDYAQKNPTKAYKVQFPAEYNTVALFLNGGPEPNWSGFTRFGKGLCEAEVERRKAIVVVPPDPVPPPASSGPITITQGGTYKGHWVSDSTTPAVTINTSQSVIIENSIIESTATGPNDNLLSQSGAGSLTIRHCTFNGPNAFPNAGWGRAIRCENFKSVLIENCEINRTGGIYLLNPGDAPSVIVRYNKMRNGQGNASGLANVRQFLQLNGIRAATQLLAEWNEVINQPNLSRTEDVFSVYDCVNAIIRNNYVEGQYAYPLSARSSGSGILLADLGSSVGNQAYDNQIVGWTNIAIGIAGGHGHRIYNNTCVSDGKAPDGTILGGANNGVTCYDYYNVPAQWYDNRVYGNKLGSMQNQGGTLVRADEYCPGAANSVPADNTFYYGNHSTPITHADETTEWSVWQNKLTTNNIKLGV